MSTAASRTTDGSDSGSVPGRYPQSQQPGVTTGAVLRFLESVNGRAWGRAHQAGRFEEARWIAGEVAVPRSRKGR